MYSQCVEKIIARMVRCYTTQAYLNLEQNSEIRHELINGELFAMVGPSRAHNLLATRLATHLVNHLDSTPCRVFQSDMNRTYAKPGLTTLLV